MPGIKPARRGYLHTEPPSVLNPIALTTLPWGQLCNLFKDSPFFLAENALLWGHGTMESVSESVSDSRALVIRYPAIPNY